MKVYALIYLLVFMMLPNSLLVFTAADFARLLLPGSGIHFSAYCSREQLGGLGPGALDPVDVSRNTFENATMLSSG